MSTQAADQTPGSAGVGPSGPTKMTLPITVTTRNPEQQVEDALMRAIDGIDMEDPELFASAFIQDAVIDYNGTILKGFRAIVKDFYTPISRMTTTHFVSNVRVLLLSKYKATISAKILGQNYSLSEGLSNPPHVLSGSAHRLILGLGSSGRWAISYWKFQTIWSDDSRSVIQPPPSYDG